MQPEPPGHDRAQAERATHGLVKVVATPRGRVLGATILGPSAGELIQTWALAIPPKIKVGAGAKEREEMKRMADIFRAHVIDVSDNTYTIELTGDGRKLDAFIQALDQGAILETVRTGTSGIGRGNRILRV